MSIKMLQGFNIVSDSPVDERLILSYNEMLSLNDNVMPEKYFAFCTDDNLLYYYDKNASASLKTGKFSPITVSGNTVVRGYFFNDSFYTDSTYTKECVKSLNCLYIDENTNGNLYTWDGEQYNPSIKKASDLQEGIMKLYSSYGNNEDGTMTQKAITESISSIKFNIDTQNEECLVLDLPW